MKGIGEILVLMLMLPFFAEAQVIPEYKDIPQLSSAYEVLDRSMFPGVVTKEHADSIKAINNYFYNTYNSVRSDLQSDRLQQVSAFYLPGRIINPYAHSGWITNPAEQG